MIKQTHDTEALLQTLEPYLNELEGFVAEAWLEQEPNVCFTDGNGNFALFEYNEPKKYTGHYFFVDRGKKALNLAKEFLEFFFTNYEVEVIRGMTPIESLGARWLSRQIGFKSHGVIYPINRPCELFILTRKEYKDMNKYE